MFFATREMQGNTRESIARKVIEGCADCDVGRYLMEDTSCLVFAELYTLYDKEREEKGEITPQELRRLVDLCNFCGLCPCPDVRSNLMKAKHAFVHREGLKASIRLLEDVERVARICGAFPRLANLAFECKLTEGVLRSLAGIMGFKRDFHEVSVAMGRRLLEKIGTLRPERLLSDCLSCRIQFNQLLPYQVLHPIEVLREAYMNCGT